MKKVVIYIRVSTDEQAKNGLSLDGQLKACTDYAARNDMDVVRVFREEGESAKTTKRPQLLEMIEYCQQQKGLISAVIVWKVDRFARNTEDHLVIKATLKKSGVSLASVTEPIEDTTVGRLMETMLAGFAQFDNEVRAERSTGGMIARVEEGGWPYVAPVGYRNQKDALGRPSLVADERGQFVARWLRIYLKGTYTQTEMWKMAEPMGVTNKAGRRLSKQQVSNMLRNPVYAGYTYHKQLEGLRDGLHEGLISMYEYEAIQNLLAGKKRGIVQTAKGIEWPLRAGFVCCALCGSAVTGSSPRGNGGIYPKYSCPACRRSVTGKKVSEDKDVIHEQFKAELNNIKFTEKRLRLFREVVLERWNNGTKDARANKERLDAEISKLKARKQRVMDLLIDGTINPDEKQAQTGSIDREVAKMEAARSEALEEELNKETVVEYGINFIGNVAKLWEDANPKQKQRFQKMVFPEGISYDFGVGFGTARLGLSFEIIRQSADNKSNMVGLAGFEPATNRL